MALCKVVMNDHKIHAISRPLLDLHWQKRKLTSEEQEEMLIKYDPMIHTAPLDLEGSSTQIRSSTKGSAKSGRASRSNRHDDPCLSYCRQV